MSSSQLPKSTNLDAEKGQSNERRKEDATAPRTPSPASVSHEANWRDTEEQVLPKNNIPLVFFALLLTTFLVSLYVA